MSKILHRLTGLDGKLEVYPDRVYFPHARRFILIRDLEEAELREDCLIFYTGEEETTFPFDAGKYDLALRVRDTIDRRLWEYNRFPIVRTRKRRADAALPAVLLGVCVAVGRGIVAAAAPDGGALWRLLRGLLWKG